MSFTFLFSSDSEFPKLLTYECFMLQKPVRKYPRPPHRLLDQVLLQTISLRKHHSLRGKRNPKLNKRKKLRKRIRQKLAYQPKCPAEGMVCIYESRQAETGFCSGRPVITDKIGFCLCLIEPLPVVNYWNRLFYQ